MTVIIHKQRPIPKPQKYLKLMYERCNRRCLSIFGHPVNFTFLELITIADIKGYKRLFRLYRKKIHLDNSRGSRSVSEAPCIDRINPLLPYTLQNIQIISQSDNSKKQDMPTIAARQRCRNFYAILQTNGFTKDDIARSLDISIELCDKLFLEAKGMSFEILQLLKSGLNISWDVLGLYIETSFGSDLPLFTHKTND